MGTNHAGGASPANYVAPELDLTLQNEQAERSRRIRSRVYWPKLLPNGHGILALAATKARLLHKQSDYSLDRYVSKYGCK